MNKKRYTAPITMLLSLTTAVYANSPAGFIDKQSWRNLCTPNTSQALRIGCYPDCTQNGSAQSAACVTILQGTSLEAYAGITENLNIRGMYVIGFKPTTGSDPAGPTILNNGPDEVSCALFSAQGKFIPPTNTAIPVTLPTVYTPPIVIASGASSNYAKGPGARLFNTGSVPTNTNYYLICQGYNGTGNVVPNVTPSWPGSLEPA